MVSGQRVEFTNLALIPEEIEARRAARREAEREAEREAGQEAEREARQEARREARRGAKREARLEARRRARDQDRTEALELEAARVNAELQELRKRRHKEAGPRIARKKAEPTRPPATVITSVGRDTGGCDGQKNGRHLCGCSPTSKDPDSEDNPYCNFFSLEHDCGCRPALAQPRNYSWPQALPFEEAPAEHSSSNTYSHNRHRSVGSYDGTEQTPLEMYHQESSQGEAQGLSHPQSHGSGRVELLPVLVSGSRSLENSVRASDDARQPRPTQATGESKGEMNFEDPVQDKIAPKLEKIKTFFINSKNKTNKPPLPQEPTIERTATGGIIAGMSSALPEESETPDVILSTTGTLPGYHVNQLLGVVSGVEVRSRNIFATITQSGDDKDGAEMSKLTKMVFAARGRAIERLSKACAERGGNAIISMRFDQTSGNGHTMVCAYGTAAVVSQIPEGDKSDSESYSSNRSIAPSQSSRVTTLLSAHESQSSIIRSPKGKERA